ncbi:STAS/SEC14 domain-containing protein [Paraburkholderia sp. RL18-085-BIA-A]
MILYHTEPDSPVIEISVEGKITDHDLREAIERMRGDLELNGKTRVLERIEHFTGIEPKALWTDITLGVSVARKVTRAAVVADAGLDPCLDASGAVLYEGRSQGVPRQRARAGARLDQHLSAAWRISYQSGCTSERG